MMNRETAMKRLVRAEMDRLVAQARIEHLMRHLEGIDILYCRAEAQERHRELALADAHPGSAT